MTIQYYDGTNEPIPDGYRMLSLKKDPHNQEKGPVTIKLEFRDYTHFKFDSTGQFFCGYHHQGYVEMYAVHNILYMEMNPNSEEVVAALREFAYPIDVPVGVFDPIGSTANEHPRDMGNFIASQLTSQLDTDKELKEN